MRIYCLNIPKYSIKPKGKKNLHRLQMDIAALDQRTRDTLADVKFFSRRMWSAVEEREKQLFKQTVEARRWKFEALQEKYLNLKEDRNRLSQAISALKCAIHDSRMSSSATPDDLLKRKDIVQAEVIYFLRQ